MSPSEWSLWLCQRPGLRRPRRPKGKFKNTPEQCSQPSPQHTFSHFPHRTKLTENVISDTASANYSAHSVKESNIPLKRLSGLPRGAEFPPLTPRGEESGTPGTQRPRPNAGSAHCRVRRPPDAAGWSAPASQPLTAHSALHDLPGQHLGQPEHLHFNNQRENLLCYPVVGPQGSPAHLLLVIKDGRWPREGAERSQDSPRQELLAAPRSGAREHAQDAELAGPRPLSG